MDMTVATEKPPSADGNELTANAVRVRQINHGERLDTLQALADHADVTTTPADGLLLVRFAPDGSVIPYVLRLGLMSEGRLERAIMTIYSTIVRVRAQANQVMMRKQFEEQQAAHAAKETK